jgi:hypothetical protein
MKKLYPWILLVLSFGALKSNAQTQTAADSVKNWTTESMHRIQDSDKKVSFDTIWISNYDDFESIGYSGKYEPTTGTIVLRYLASRIENVKLQNEILYFNSLLTTVYGHEKDHEKSGLCKIN